MLEYRQWYGLGFCLGYGLWHGLWYLFGRGFRYVFGYAQWVEIYAREWVQIYVRVRYGYGLGYRLIYLTFCPLAFCPASILWHSVRESVK